MQERAASPSPSNRTTKSTTTTSSSRDLAASSLRNEVREKGFSIVVTLLSSSRSSGSAPVMPITRLIQKRKSTAASLKLPTTSEDLTLLGDSETSSSVYRVLQPRPSMLSMPTSKQYEKAKRVRLTLDPDDRPVLEVKDESKGKLLHSVDLSRVDANGVHTVDKSLFHLPNVLFLPLTAPSSQTFLSPTLPSFSADLHLGRSTSLALNSHGASPTRGASGGRRPSTASSTLGSIPSFGASATSSSEKEKTKDEHGLYLHFESSSAHRSWLALLQSNAVPEIYHFPPSIETPPITPGRESSSTSSTDPSAMSFRLKREVKLTVGEARSLVLSSSSSSSSKAFTPHSASFADARVPLTPLHSPHPFVQAYQSSHHDESSSADVYVEVLSGSQPIGRTTVKRQAPVWDETFTFPFFSVERGEGGGMLRLVVWREKSGGKQVAVGKVEVPLGGWFPQGDKREDCWWPVLGENGRRMGDLRLRVSALEQVVFPLERYGNLATMTQDAMEEPNSILAQTLWRRDFDQSVIARMSMRVALAQGRVGEVVGALLRVENLSADTLFRSNSPFTKCIDTFLKEQLAPSFIPHALSRTIHHIIDNKVSIEILPPTSLCRQPSGDEFEEGEMFMTDGQRRELERQRRELMRLVESCWEDIYSARQRVPAPVREALRKVFETVPSEVKWRAITTLFFLRLITPAIIHPQSFGLSLATPEGPVRRTLLLLAKAMSALSYGGLSDKQPEMHAIMNSFAIERHEQVVDFIAFVTRKEDPAGHLREQSGIDGYLTADRVDGPGDVVRSLFRESLLVKPHYNDDAADRAVVANLVFRALTVMEEDETHERALEKLTELRELVTGIIDDEADACEWLMLGRMPPGFVPRVLVSNLLPSTPEGSEPDMARPVRPPTRSSRSQILSENSQVLLPVRPGFHRHRSGSSSSFQEGPDSASTFSHATLGRTDFAALAANASAFRRPSLPVSLLPTKVPNPVFGLKPAPVAIRRRDDSLSDDGFDKDDDDDDDDRPFVSQRATFSAKVSRDRDKTLSTLSADQSGWSTRSVAESQKEVGSTSAGRRRWKHKVWNLKL